MTPDPLLIPEGERGLVRLFRLTLDQGRLIRLVQDGETGLLPALLGHPDLDPGHIDLVRIADLGDLRLDGYLTEGHDIAPDAMADDLPLLHSLTGHVLIVLSGALPAGGRLAPGPEASFVAVFAQADPDPARLWPGPQTGPQTGPGRAATATPLPAPRSTLPAAKLVALAGAVLLLGLLLVWLR